MEFLERLVRLAGELNEFRPVAGEYLHVQFADYLQGLVRAGRYVGGNPLPNERWLAEEHGVSIGTVRRSLDVLRQRAVVVTLRGKGTFITSTNIDSIRFDNIDPREKESEESG